MLNQGGNDRGVVVVLGWELGVDTTEQSTYRKYPKPDFTKNLQNHFSVLQKYEIALAS